MDLQSFISSGILELYVHGLATPDEVREVEHMAREHPEVQQEIAAIQRALDGYLQAHGTQPPAGLREKIMQRVEGVPKGQPASQTMPDATRLSHRSQRFGGGTSRVSMFATWLLGLVLLGALAVIYQLWQQAGRAAAQTEKAKADLEQLRQDCDAEKAKAQEANELLIALRHWDTKAVPMRGTPLGGNAFAIVYWNKTKKHSYLNVVNLPKPPADKQYQLWAIVDGKPTDMGVFDIVEGNPLQKVEHIENPQAFAVTLEPKGGSQVPTLDQMWVVGPVARG